MLWHLRPPASSFGLNDGAAGNNEPQGGRDSLNAFRLNVGFSRMT